VANRLLAIGAFEETASRGKLIDVWSDGVFGSVAAKFGAEVINRNKEDIGFF
jgi:hypothetical protein